MSGANPHRTRICTIAKDLGWAVEKFSRACRPVLNFPTVSRHFCIDTSLESVTLNVEIMLMQKQEIYYVPEAPARADAGLTGTPERSFARHHGRSSILDAIRGVAVLQVVAFHYLTPLVHGRSAVAETFLGMTWTGVDLFFCLSGFLIGGIIVDQSNSPNFYRVFYARRALRILPLYLLLLAAYFLWSQSVAGVWAYATFTQNLWWAQQGSFGPLWTVATWSLAVEEQFYLVLPVLIRFCPRQRLTVVLIGLICLTPVVRFLTVALYGNRYSAYLLFPCRMDALFLGVLAAWTIRQPVIIDKIQQLRAVQVILLLTLWGGFAGLLMQKYSIMSPFMQQFGYTWVGLTYAVTLFVIMLNPECDAISAKYLSLLSNIGLGAYSIYLFHLPLLAILSFLHHGSAVVLGATVLLIPLAMTAWCGVEKPLITLGRMRFRYQTRLADRSTN